ncbi:Oligopeptidase B [Chloroherpeton thalassium ATCC 35110]|uniref:Oligopeptidase B n=1 Tax=Chloroherpeton thalassium (strain ATCC 35110 / GB-78) TaxID=517418 RepID=B3QSX6_CHLT3|nr:oligopeptidase B [Chloroherpeton thalassium]ACF12619.1 Oligopeptidase B [Chloroherpeton thalassium ATCC 35110]
MSKKSAISPVAKKKPIFKKLHGITLQDDYFWLREKTNPEVIAYLEAENRYTADSLKHTTGLQKKLYEEMLARIKETDLSVPDKKDDFYYYSRTEKGKQYSIFCRKQGSAEAKEEILLDKNKLAEGHSFFSTGVIIVSPNHQYLAFSTDKNGSETYILYIKDLQTGRLFHEQIENVSTAVWANDNKTLFYTIVDKTKRPYKVLRHVLGQPVSHDVEVYHEKEQGFEINLSRSKSGAFIFLHTSIKTQTEVRFLRADCPEARFQLVQSREKNHEYSVEHHDDRFFILTNKNAINFRLMTAPVSNPESANWTECIAANDHVKIDHIAAFREHLVVFERRDGLQQLCIIHLDSKTQHAVQFPEPVYTFWPALNPDFNTSVLRFHYTSLVTPETVYDYDMNTKKWELKKRYEVLGGYEPANYESERIFAKAEDGAEIPISLVYKKGLKKDGSNPIFLYGYGSYGINIEPEFRSMRLSLLDRGFIFAIAHIRGGEEMGRRWYEDGKFLKKKNSFTDFIACTEHLVAEKYASPKKLVISGGSAGGLLMGAVINMRPELFTAVVANVPFVDVLNTMLDPSLPLTISEYDEWGSPEEKDYFEYIRSYSPYDNVQEVEYPNMLVTGGLHDPRVSYWEPAKWVAKMRAMKKGNNRLFLKINMGAGHSGASGRYDYLKELALEYAFILDSLGIPD